HVLCRVSFLAAALALSSCAHFETPSAKSPAPVLSLPNIALATLDGGEATLESALSGKVALVSFWASWCDACAGELDALKRLTERLGSRGGMVLGVAVGEPRASVAAFVRAHGLTYPQLVDEEFKLADTLGQKRVPTTLVVDHAGRVTYLGGALDEEALSA